MHRLAVGIYDDDRLPASWCGCTARSSTSTATITEVPALQGVSRGKLILVNDDDLTYCSLRLDPESLQTVLTRIADIAEPLPRTLVWSAAWEMTRDAELQGPRLRRAGDERCAGRDRGRCGAAAAAAGADRAELLRRARLGVRERAGRRSAIGCWTWPASRPRVRTISWRSSTRCARRCCRATTSRCWRRCWTTNPPTVNLAGPGDRHRSALAHRHRAGRRRRHRRRRPGDTVHRRRGEARPDRGGQAARRGARRRPARRPRSRSRPGSRSSRTTRWPTSPRARSSADSCSPVRASCLRRSRARYFAAIPGVWERRSSEVAQTVVIGLYPSWDISEQALHAADRVPRRTRCRRRCAGWCSKGRAGVERSLKARAFDAG